MYQKYQIRDKETPVKAKKYSLSQEAPCVQLSIHSKIYSICNDIHLLLLSRHDRNLGVLPRTRRTTSGDSSPGTALPERRGSGSATGGLSSSEQQKEGYSSGTTPSLRNTDRVHESIVDA